MQASLDGYAPENCPSGNHDHRLNWLLDLQETFRFRKIVKIDNTVMIAVGTARPERDEGG